MGSAHPAGEESKGGCIWVRSPGRGCNLQLASRQPGDFESDLILFFFIIANSTTTGPPLLPLSVSVSVSRSCFWYYQILAVSTFSFLFLDEFFLDEFFFSEKGTAHLFLMIRKRNGRSLQFRFLVQCGCELMSVLSNRSRFLSRLSPGKKMIEPTPRPAIFSPVCVSIFAEFG